MDTKTYNTMKAQSNFQKLPDPKVTTAGPDKAVAAEQKLKGNELGNERTLKSKELLSERELTHEELLAEHTKTKKLLATSQEKVKDLTEAVRYRDRKISKLGTSGGTGGRTVGSNVMDHSHLGEAKAHVETPAQVKALPAPVAKAATTRKVLPGKY
jgi:hypothetical protein